MAARSSGRTSAEAGKQLLLLVPVRQPGGAASPSIQLTQMPTTILQAPAPQTTYAQGWPYQEQPAAAAYFPLLDANLTSTWPGGAYAGEGFGVTWRQDPVFGMVLACDEVCLARGGAGATLPPQFLSATGGRAASAAVQPAAADLPASPLDAGGG